MQQFRSGSPKLRVYNPQLDRDGWESLHTIVEIVNDDMPFLVDSVTMEINRQGLAAYLTVHPVIRTKRKADGDLVEILPPSVEQGRSESIIRVEVDRQTDPRKLADLEEGMLRILSDVRLAVEDYPKIKSVVIELATAVKQQSLSGLSIEIVDEVEAFLLWLTEKNFVFLGYRDCNLVQESGEDVLQVVSGSGLGILRETSDTQTSKSFATVAPEIRRLARAADLLVLTKANTRSTVHRAGYLDYVGVKRFNEMGGVMGERRFLGLYTFNASIARLADIPLLRQKFKNVVARSGFEPNGHMWKALVTALEQHPRDELLQRTEDELLDDGRGIVSLGYRQRPRIFVRSDPYGRFLSCLVYLPRENYNAALREHVQRILVQAFNGVSSEFTLHVSESALVRVYIIVRTKSGTVPEFDIREIEKLIVKTARRWEDDLHVALVLNCGEERGNDLYHRFGDVFPSSYQENCSIAEAVVDVDIMDGLAAEKRLAVRLYEDSEPSQDALRLRVIHLGEPVPLSSSLPMLEHMGVQVLEELNWKVEPQGIPPIFIHDFGMNYVGKGKVDLAKAKRRFEKMFARAWAHEIEDDDFNRLVLRANLDSREITILRAYAKYLRQTGFPFSQAYMEQALFANPAIAERLVHLFLARFNPADLAESGTTTLLLITETLSEMLNEYLTPDECLDKELLVERPCGENVPPDLGRRLAKFDHLYSALDIIEIATQTTRSVEEVAFVYFGIGARLELPWLRKQIEGLAAESLWQMLAKAALRDDSHDLQKELALSVSTLHSGIREPADLVQIWETQYKTELTRNRRVLAEVRSTGNLDLSMAAVAFRQLRDFVSRAKSPENDSESSRHSRPGAPFS
jgi:glutamate dehydrogenase